jgi:glucose uptake protein GlcU
VKLIRRLAPHQWAWLHFKLAVGLGWGHAILFVTPQIITDTTTESSIRVWAYGTIIGAIVSIVGLFMSTSSNRKRKARGTHIEVVGVVLFAGGPLQYFILQVTFLPGDFEGRYALMWFAYGMLSACITRIVILLGFVGKKDADTVKDNE